MSMTISQTYKMMSRHRSLAYRRNPMFTKNQTAKIVSGIGMGILAFYLMGIGVSVGYVAQGDAMQLFWLLPLMLMADFIIRISLQETPTAFMKPYWLTPIPRRLLTTCYVWTAVLNPFNILWMSLTVPYSIICLCGKAPVIDVVAVVMIWQLAITVNGLWTLAVKLLTTKNLVWWLLPLMVYSFPFVAVSALMSDGDALNCILDFAQEHCASWPCVGILSATGGVLFWYDTRLVRNILSDEIGKDNMQRSHFTLLSQVFRRMRVHKPDGRSSRYFLLEVNAALRCKAIRQRYLSGIWLITLLSIVLSFTELYEGPWMSHLWCVYCFVYFGAVCLSRAMGMEGNYIDLLMLHKENIYRLLKAKYGFFSMLLVIPLFLLSPAVYMGKLSVLTLVSTLAVTMGPVYCLLFQMAVYNKQALPLYERINTRGNDEMKYSLMTELAVFAFPLLLNRLLAFLCGDIIGEILLTIVGVLFVIAHPWWLRNVYHRMMRRRYENLDGFHATITSH